MGRTKIVATIGPASRGPNTIRKMLRAGMNVARINFSHGDHETHTETVARLRQVAQQEGKVLAILGDLQGPKIRLGSIASGGIPLKQNDEIMLTSHRGQPAMIHLPHPDLIEAIQVGGRLVIGDGEIEMSVLEKSEGILRCLVTVPGLLEARKGVNAPQTSLPIPSITEKDKVDLKFACKLDLDYIALSFVRSPDDIHELRDLMRQYRDDDALIPIIAKIEKSEAIWCLEAIGEVADGMMVARGDLGIDMPAQEVPVLQKRIIACCNMLAKPVITATQMLQSMVEHPRPTRAEASDVANAILDGTDAVMLSNETAMGSYPVESVQMMKNISDITEQEFAYEIWKNRPHLFKKPENRSITEAIGQASCDVAHEVAARAIVSTTMSGSTARRISRYRPRTPIIAVSPLAKTQRRLALVWGVTCLLAAHYSNTDAMIDEAVAAVKPLGLAPGDRIVITAGVPFGETGQTNLIQVYEI
ncbi:MAG TPA: pyruvate kinase [Anaerolineae bacterium]|nr:pyruvate kinase [Anaerolineae bacterium]